MRATSASPVCAASRKRRTRTRVASSGVVFEAVLPVGVMDRPGTWRRRGMLGVHRRMSCSPRSAGRVTAGETDKTTLAPPPAPSRMIRSWLRYSSRKWVAVHRSTGGIGVGMVVLWEKSGCAQKSASVDGRVHPQVGTQPVFQPFGE